MHGILVKNTSGQILISSEITSLHCGGEALYRSTILSGLTNFPSFGNDDARITLSGRHVHRYSFTSIDAPVFFIKPTVYEFFHGILQQFYQNGAWYVDIIQSGVYSAPPIVYAFTTPSNLSKPDGGVGIAAYLPDGTKSFDSRLLPLAIYNAQTVIPPVIPCDGGQPGKTGGHPWNNTHLDFDFRSETTFHSYPLSSDIYYGQLMFTGPSVAQAVYSRQKNGFKRSEGLFSSQDHWSTAVWWAMYHSAYRILAGELHAGWSVYAADFWFSSTWESTGWYEFSGGGGSIHLGKRPFNDKTINYSSNTLIVADSFPYR